MPESAQPGSVLSRGAPGAGAQVPERQGDKPGEQAAGRFLLGMLELGGMKYLGNFTSQPLLVYSEFLKFLSHEIVVLSLQCLSLGVLWTSNS